MGYRISSSFVLRCPTDRAVRSCLHTVYHWGSIPARRCEEVAVIPELVVEAFLDEMEFLNTVSSGVKGDHGAVLFSRLYLPLYSFDQRSPLEFGRFSLPSRYGL